MRLRRGGVPREPGVRSYAGAIETMQAWLDGEPVWPYAKIIETWGSRFEMYRLRWRRELSVAMTTGVIGVAEYHSMADVYALRDEWVARFGFAIPCAELLDELAASKLVVDAGAGSGYMTRLMRNRGIEVIGSDIGWPGENSHGFMTGFWDCFQVSGTAAKTMARRYPEATMFCSWPTLDETWFRQMLRAMRIGQKLVVIREDACAEDSAWQYFDDCFDETRNIYIPAFECMNDFAIVGVKKRQRPA
jgi:hypothetical protein